MLVATRQRLESLPAYRADDEITDVVSSLLWNRSNMHQDDLRSVQVRTRDGIVHLSGETRTEQTRLAIEEQVRGVRGVLGVRNDLRTFEALGAAAQSFKQRHGPIDHHRPDGPALAPFHLDGDHPGHDGHPGTELAAFELDAEVATPLRTVA